MMNRYEVITLISCIIGLLYLVGLLIPEYLDEKERRRYMIKRFSRLKGSGALKK